MCRYERAFRTVQDRLPEELTLAGITTLETANRFVAEDSLAKHAAALLEFREISAAGASVGGGEGVAALFKTRSVSPAGLRAGNSPQDARELV